MESDLKKFGKDTIIYVLGAVSSRLLSFILIPIYVRYLTPDDYGILELFAVSIVLSAIFLRFGLENALLRFYFETNDLKERGKIVFTCFIFITIPSLLICSGVFIFADIIALLFFRHTLYSSFLRVTAVAIFFSVITMIPNQLFMLNKESKLFSIINVCYIVAGFILNIIFIVFLKKGVYGVLVGNMYLYILTAIACFYIKRHSITPSFSIIALSKMLVYSIPFIFVGFFVWVINCADRYFMVQFVSTHELGIYSVANRFAQVIMLIVSAFQMGWYPFAYSVMASEKAKEMYKWTLRIYVALMGGVIISFSFFLGDVFGVFLTPEFSPPVGAVLILSLGFVFWGAYHIFFIGSGIAKKSLGLVGIAGLAAVINTMSNFFLIPKYGLLGASYSTLFAFFFMAVFMYIYSQRHYKIEYGFGRILPNVLFIVLLIYFGGLINLSSTLLPIKLTLKVVLICGYCLLAVMLLMGKERAVRFSLRKEKSVLRLIRGVYYSIKLPGI